MENAGVFERELIRLQYSCPTKATPGKSLYAVWLMSKHLHTEVNRLVQSTGLMEVFDELHNKGSEGLTRPMNLFAGEPRVSRVIAHFRF